jgi:hypothetical protein
MSQPTKELSCIESVSEWLFLKENGMYECHKVSKGRVISFIQQLTKLKRELIEDSPHVIWIDYGYDVECPSKKEMKHTEDYFSFLKNYDKLEYIYIVECFRDVYGPETLEDVDSVSVTQKVEKELNSGFDFGSGNRHLLTKWK